MFDILCITNRKLCKKDFLKHIEEVATASPKAVILREKDLTEEEYRMLAKEVFDICRKYDVNCILHSFTEVAKELKKQDPSLDISAVEAEQDEFEAEDKSEIIFVQIGLWILSGSLFGFIWSAFLLKSVKEFSKTYKNVLAWILSTFVPFVNVYFMLKAHKEMKAVADELGVKLMNLGALYVVTGILLPILPINFIGLAFMQANANRIHRAVAKKEESQRAEAVVA